MSLENERASLNAGSGRKFAPNQPMQKQPMPGKSLDEMRNNASEGSEGAPQR